jgi:hypothetical protein
MMAGREPAIIFTPRQFASVRGEMTMSIKLTIALVVMIACAAFVFAEAGENHDTLTSAQYCVPQYDNSDAVRIYC